MSSRDKSDCGTQIVLPVTFQVVPQLSKQFLWALYQEDNARSGFPWTGLSSWKHEACLVHAMDGGCIASCLQCNVQNIKTIWFRPGLESVFQSSLSTYPWRRKPTKAHVCVCGWPAHIIFTAYYTALPYLTHKHTEHMGFHQQGCRDDFWPSYSGGREVIEFKSFLHLPAAVSMATARCCTAPHQPLSPLTQHARLAWGGKGGGRVWRHLLPFPLVAAENNQLEQHKDGAKRLLPKERAALHAFICCFCARCSHLSH